MKQKNTINMRKLKVSFCNSVLPTKRDNLSQMILKIIYLLALILIISFFFFVAIYFSSINAEQSLFSANKKIFAEYSHGNDTDTQKALNYFKKQNGDFMGWITIENTDLSAPIYQTEDNKFYKNHNQLKNKSKSGALFFDCKDTFSEKDKNLIIYGKNEKHLFSCLQNYKSKYYYLENPIIKISTFDSTDNYVIFAAFIINSKKDDDNGYIFNYKKSSFKSLEQFDDWYDEITERSLYTTNISVSINDSFITLVTDSVEFNGAKLVIMARKLESSEKNIYLTANVNKIPRYPQIYYDIKGIKNPFNKESNYVS